MIKAFLKKWWVESDFKAPNLPLSLRLKGSDCHYNSIHKNTGTKELKLYKYRRVIRYLNRKKKRKKEICCILKAYAFVNLIFAILHRLVTYYKLLIGPPTPSQGICAQLRSISMMHGFLFIIQQKANIYSMVVKYL